MLRADHELSLKNKPNSHKDAYEQFIFSQLTKGAKTGNMLHYLFENIAFNHDGKWDFAIKHAVQRYAPLRAELYTPMLKIMLDMVLNASINTGEETFKLSDVSPSRSIHELEFDFKVSPFQVSQLGMLSDDNMEVRVKEYFEMEGVMNGKIDLFFEHQGKYYVLDWKSNYLGDSLEDYSSDSLALAMNENNYHLQYLIYSLATKKYLESRLPDFDYETQFGGVIYLFVRGLRKDREAGLFTYKPSLEKLERLNGLLEKKDFKEVEAI
jgi:exodeoxyribonuclease V beta subunit